MDQDSAVVTVVDTAVDTVEATDMAANTVMVAMESDKGNYQQNIEKKKIIHRNVI